MRLTPSERDRLLIFTAAELARSRQRRGVRLNVPEATAIIADAVCEAARDGRRLLEAAAAGASILTINDVLDGVADIVTEVKVEAVFNDGTRLVVVRDPFAAASLGSDAPGAVLSPDDERLSRSLDVERTAITVINTSDVPVSITSHFHFFEVNPRLDFDRVLAFGQRLDIDAGTTARFDPGVPSDVMLVPIGGARVAVGFAGLVDGPLDDPDVRAAAIDRAAQQGYLGVVR
jgi:urease subunit gamma/beta